MLKKAVKLIGINFFILISLLICINLGLVIVYEVHQGYKSVYRSIKGYPADSRAMLPNYHGIKWAHKHFQEFSRLSTEYKSYIGWRRLPFRGETINIGSNGIRYTPQHKLVTDSSPLVVFLGGSTMFGTGANDANTIPAIFSDISLGRYRTINLGETEYRAFQSYLFLKQEIDKGLKPDIVISYDGYNEVAGFRSEVEATSHSREGQIRSLMKGQDTKEGLNNLTFRNFFLGPIEIFIERFKAKSKYDKAKDMYDLSHERTLQVAKALLDSWMSTKVLAEQNGAIFIAVLQPNAAVGNPNLTHFFGGDKDSQYLEACRQLYPMVLKLLKENPVYKDLLKHFIDFSDSFDGHDYFYIDFCHVSPNGNKIIAERIHEYLRNYYKSK